MKKILLASKNAHKVEEFQAILEPYGYTVISLKDLDDHDEVVEDGRSFMENSMIKVNYYYDKYQMDVIADDSGISIDYFNGEPGIHSARFLPHLDYPTKNQLIIDLMKGVENRGAYYSCSIAFVIDGVKNGVEAKWYGSIAHEQKGTNGFGYDPIFYLDEYGMTSAELEPNVKNAISHRALAAKELVKYFEK